MNISKEIVEIPLENLFRSKLNPREDVGDLAYLGDTIDRDGIFEPLIVIKRNGNYEVIVGERRREAAESLGLKTVPCRLAELTDEEALVLIAIEDHQRMELSEKEKANLFSQMSKTMSYEDIAGRIGSLTTAYIKTIMQILNLPKGIQSMVERSTMDKPEERTLTYGKAIRLIGLPEPIQNYIVKKIVDKGIAQSKLQDQVRNVKSAIEFIESKSPKEQARMKEELMENLDEVMDQGQMFFIKPEPKEGGVPESKLHKHVFILSDNEVETVLGLCEKYIGRVPENYVLKK